MATWTDPQVVIDSWVGGNKPTDITLVRTWVDRAERVLRQRIPDLAERVIAGTEPDLPATIEDVVSNMVARVFRNPDGVRQYQETVGSISEGRTFSGTTGVLEPTAQELARLQGTRARPRAFEINLAPTPTVATWLTTDSWESA